MNMKFHCVNIGSKDPKRLAEFYSRIGAFVTVRQGRDYDGWSLGGKNEASVYIWDENLWGPSTAGYITIVFLADNLHETYLEINKKGISCPPPEKTPWGGEKLSLLDPDGNKIVILKNEPKEQL